MEKNLTDGSVIRNIFVFSLSYLLSYLLQTLYGMADLFIIGQFGSVADSSAVSIGSQVMHMITVQLVRKVKFRMVLIDSPLKIHSFLDMEKPIRELDRNQTEAVVFLGKVGVGIALRNLEKGLFDRYDCSFLLLDKEDCFEGESTEIPETLCVSVRFHRGTPKLLHSIKNCFPTLQSTI